jgi:hypothetical protein
MTTVLSEPETTSEEKKQSQINFFMVCDPKTGQDSTNLLLYMGYLAMTQLVQNYVKYQESEFEKKLHADAKHDAIMRHEAAAAQINAKTFCLTMMRNLYHQLQQRAAGQEQRDLVISVALAKQVQLKPVNSESPVTCFWSRQQSSETSRHRTLEIVPSEKSTNQKLQSIVLLEPFAQGFVTFKWLVSHQANCIQRIRQRLQKPDLARLYGSLQPDKRLYGIMYSGLLADLVNEILEKRTLVEKTFGLS